MEEKKRLTRSNNKMIGGVCAGLAEYLDLDPTIVRIVWVLMVLFAGFGILLYVILWLIMPKQQIGLRMNFEISSSFSPTGDQPEAIAALSEGIKNGVPFQTLLGVTGSGKTFTLANVIKEVQRPTLILSHNKTLAAQLYGEFKAFFPNNAVEYFVSYYDYYQPEAYLPSTDTYIEKD